MNASGETLAESHASWINLNNSHIKISRSYIRCNQPCLEGDILPRPLVFLHLDTDQVSGRIKGIGAFFPEGNYIDMQKQETQNTKFSLNAGSRVNILRKTFSLTGFFLLQMSYCKSDMQLKIRLLQKWLWLKCRSAKRCDNKFENQNHARFFFFQHTRDWDGLRSMHK